MKRHYLTCVLSVFPLLTMAAEAKLTNPFREGQVAFVFDCDKQLCLDNTIKPGRKVFLLSDKGTMCEAITGDNFTYEIEEVMISIPSTKLKPGHPCMLGTNYVAAVVTSKPKKYRMLNLEEISDARIKKSLTARVASSNVPRDFFKPGDRACSGVEIAALSASPVRFQKISFFKHDFFILSYDYYEGGSGPKVLLSKGKVFPLAGPCSGDSPVLFQFGDHVFLHSRSSGCDCGLGGEELFLISPSGAKEVYSQWGWST